MMDAKTGINIPPDVVAAVEFLTALFRHTTHKIWLCSLPNVKGDPNTGPEDHIRTRDGGDIAKFVADWNVPLRGSFFCVGTVEGSKRNKTNVREIPALWADIDFKDTDEKPADILRKLKAMRYPPSRIVASGHGFHCYWLFKEPMASAVEIARIEAALKLLADLVAGDMQVTQIAALMRVPGTNNTKDADAWGSVTIIEQNDHTYELDDLEEMLLETSPFILRKERERSKTVGETNFFTDYGTQYGYRPPIDVEKRLAGMLYMGGNDSAIHTTQLSVTASLLNTGVDIDEVVQIVLAATRTAAGDYGKHWNWPGEERGIRKMCLSWLKKHPRGADNNDDDNAEQEGDERVANEAPIAKTLPTIKIHPRISLLTTETQQMLIDAKVPFYQRSGELVRPIIRTVKAAHGRLTKTAQLKSVSAIYMRDTMCRHAHWARLNERKKKWVPTMAPKNVAETLLARDGVWNFKEIVGVIATPTMRPDGSLFVKQGYDPATRLLLIEPPAMPPIPDQPMRDDALQALALLEELLCESPFEDEASKSVALSGLITPVVRGAMPVAPMHVSSAPVAGTGKSFLWDLGAAISIGQQRIPVIAAGSEEETEKRLAGVMLTGQPLISIDNVNGELKGDFLCQAIEQHYLDIRPLGRSDIVRIETGSATIFATGNNIIVVGDLCRRTIMSRLDAQLENPQLRQFKNNPIQQILDDRGKYIAACLTICRAYIVAGRPGLLPRLASFDGWSDCVRSALVWLGKADPVDTMESTRAEDPQRTMLGDVLQAWAKHHSVGAGSDVPLAVIVEKAMMMQSAGGFDSTIEPLFPDLNAAVRAAAMSVSSNPFGGGKIDLRAFGIWCRANKGRIVDGHRLMNKPSKRGGAATWWVEKR